MKFSYLLLKKLAPGIKDQKKFVEEFPLRAFEIEEIKDDAVDISIPANRYSDASSHRGIAVIMSAIFGGKIAEPKLAAIVKKNSSRKFGVKISAKNFCRRYSGLYAEISKVTASPKWVQDILISCGLRPINGIVDVMNYVMLEIGQPLHAFDADLLKGVINVRLAKNGEKMETIDNNVFTLTGQDLVIVDNSGPVAIAGIKGGKRTEINIHTRKIIIEAANFDATNIYKTSRRQNLFTDASARFAHGLSPISVEIAIKRAAQLLKELYGAKIGDWLDINYVKPAKTVVKFDIGRFNRLTGLNLKEKICFNYLKKMNFKIKGKLVIAPPERTDISIFEDLAEEIVNLHGYNKLSSEAPHIYLKTSGYEESIKFKDVLRRILIGFGLSEVYNHSFVGENGKV
ncbi:MAG: phenylalanine--tRNA ligase beta subunit-related protein, partial [Patescibacteria group bacterium]